MRDREQLSVCSKGFTAYLDIPVIIPFTDESILWSRQAIKTYRKGIFTISLNQSVSMLLLTGAGSLSWQPVPAASLMLAPALCSHPAIWVRELLQMAINQFAGGFLLVWAFFQADNLSGQAVSLSAWARAEGGRCCDQEGMAPVLSRQYGCRFA